MLKFIKQQVNNKLRTNNFTKEISIERKENKAEETAKALHWTIRIF